MLPYLSCQVLFDVYCIFYTCFRGKVSNFQLNFLLQVYNIKWNIATLAFYYDTLGFCTSKTPQKGSIPKFASSSPLWNMLKVCSSWWRMNQLFFTDQNIWTYFHVLHYCDICYTLRQSPNFCLKIQFCWKTFLGIFRVTQFLQIRVSWFL